MLDKESLEIGAIYWVQAPEFSVAIWTGTSFKGPMIYESKLIFFEGQPYWMGFHKGGTVKPLERIGSYVIKAPFDGLNLLHAMEAMNELTDRYYGEV